MTRWWSNANTASKCSLAPSARLSLRGRNRPDSLGGFGLSSKDRHSKIVSGTTTQFLYDDGNVDQEMQRSTVTADYGASAEKVNGVVSWMLQDGQGSTRQLLNGNQTVTASYTSDAFGNSVSGSGSSANPFVWNGGSGYYSDAESGLQKVGARYYDPAVGRWISQDHKIVAGSAGESQAVNRFNYCEDNPIARWDPSGDMPNAPGWLVSMMIAWSLFARNYAAAHTPADEQSSAARSSEYCKELEPPKLPKNLEIAVPDGEEAVAAAGDGVEGGEILWEVVVVVVFF